MYDEVIEFTRRILREQKKREARRTLREEFPDTCEDGLTRMTNTMAALNSRQLRNMVYGVEVTPDKLNFAVAAKPVEGGLWNVCFELLGHYKRK